MIEPSESSAKPLKLIYVVGFARSGTTILGNLLGELEGFIHVGELCRLWRKAALSKDRCGCGKSVETCALWSKAMDSALHALNAELFSGDGSAGVQSAWNLQQRAESATSWHDLRATTDKQALKDYARLMERLLESVAEESRARVIVDSSKLPKPGAYLKHMRNVTPYFLHLVRDSRGAVFSRQRRFAGQDGTLTVLNPTTTAADCFRWMRTNISAGILGRNGRAGGHRELRYEDFVSDPAPTLEAIAQWVGEEVSELPFLNAHTALLGPNHTVSGNRNRFETGEVSLVLDDRWKRSLRTRDYLLITALTGPLLAKHGYQFKRGSRISDLSDDHKPRS